MNKMNMPGFTAGASLYPAVSYRTFSISNVPSDAVVPQLTKNQLVEFIKFFAEGAAGGPGGGGGGGGSTSGLSSCLTSCARRFSDCAGTGEVDVRYCSQSLGRCNSLCFLIWGW
jgi:hypothetical protein